MNKYLPLLVVGAVTGLVSAILIVAAVTFKDNTQTKAIRNLSDKVLIKRLLSYAKAHGKSFLAVAFLILVSIGYDVCSPLIVAYIEGIIKSDFKLNELIAPTVVYALAMIISAVAVYCQSVLLQKTGQKIISAMREDVFSHIQNFSHEQLNRMKVGTLVTRVTNDLNAISTLFTNVLADLISKAVMLIGVTAAMFSINYALALVVMCFMPFIALFTLVFRKFARAAHRKVKDGTSALNAFLSENLSGVKVTQAFNCEDKKKEEFDVKNSDLYKARRQRIFVFSVYRPMVYLLYVTSVLVLFLLGSYGALDGAEIMGQVITAETIVAFYMYLSKFFDPIQMLAEHFNWLQSAFASAEKVFTILDTPLSMTDTDGAVDVEKLRGDIEFHDVWFRYTETEWVLKGVSFKIEAGQTLALVGATGAGKSTILALLTRNYDAQKGKITIDGIDIKNIRIASLRKRFGQMMQDVFLFSGTLRDNIVLNGDYTDEQIERACISVGADEMIKKLPSGLDEKVSERGANFSVGQRQLISFARTVITDPDILILDEATSNIDSETEAIIQNSLHRMMNFTTTIVVAHRLSTVMRADKILVLENGKVIEEGTHAELLRKRGKYYSLYTLQFRKDELKKLAQKSV